VAGGEQTKGQAQSDAAKLFARAKADDFMGDEYCVDCHKGISANFGQSPHAALMSDPKLPASKRGCEGCHGPGGIHQADENPEVIAFRAISAKESTAACMSETHWKRSAHSKADMSCVSCHQIHPDAKPMWEPGAVEKGQASNPRKPLFTAQVEPKTMLKADQATLCGQCHGAQVAEFRLNSHHPIPEGRMQCSDCHDTHPSKNEKVNRAADRNKCVTCHTEFQGPFVFEHDPVAGHTGSGCAECHKPHGSHNPKMLNSFSRGLCAQCHTEKLSQHYPGQSCWNAGCHVSLHGSNTSPKFLSP
jgi:predicted CXXCH cytochrome family protein